MYADGLGVLVSRALKSLERAMSDRGHRASERTGVKRWIQLMILSPEGYEPKQQVSCISRDVSRTGIGLRIAEPVEKGTPLVMGVPGIDGTDAVFGRVVHCEQAPDDWYWLGVRLEGMPDEVRAAGWVSAIGKAA